MNVPSTPILSVLTELYNIKLFFVCLVPKESQENVVMAAIKCMYVSHFLEPRSPCFTAQTFCQIKAHILPSGRNQINFRKNSLPFYCSPIRIYCKTYSTLHPCAPPISYCGWSPNNFDYFIYISLPFDTVSRLILS